MIAEMEFGNFEHFIEKKAYEIGYALFRAGGTFRGEGLRIKLENEAVDILDYSAKGKYGNLKKSLSRIERFVRFAGDTGAISQHNTSLIVSEITKLTDVVAEFMNYKMQDRRDVHLEDIFSVQPSPFEGKETFLSSERDNAAIESLEEEILEEEASDSGKNQMKAAIRQSAILEKVRQLPDCRIKDLQDSFPEVSERTLRYDIQELIGHGLIERIGSGGPGTFYRARVLEV